MQMQFLARHTAPLGAPVALAEIPISSDPDAVTRLFGWIQVASGTLGVYAKGDNLPNAGTLVNSGTARYFAVGTKVDHDAGGGGSQASNITEQVNGYFGTSYPSASVLNRPSTINGTFYQKVGNPGGAVNKSNSLLEFHMGSYGVTGLTTRRAVYALCGGYYEVDDGAGGPAGQVTDLVLRPTTGTGSFAFDLFVYEELR